MSHSTTLKQFKNRLKIVNTRLIFKKPIFLFKAFIRSIAKNYFNSKKINAVKFVTHYKCDLKCKHCYEQNFLKTNKTLLTLSEKKEIISQCLNLGVIAFSFIGGETSLDPDLQELIKACKPYRTYITLATNAYSLTEEKIKQFSDWGIDKLSISLDSWNKEEHDANRGCNGVYKKVFETVDICKKIGIIPQLGVVVVKHFTKTDDFKKIIEYSVNTKTSLGLIPAISLGGWEGNYDILITLEDRKVMDELNKKYGFISSDIYSNKEHRCQAFKDIFTITAFGEIMPCNFIHISFGDLKKEELSVILDKACKHKVFAQDYNGCLAAENLDFIQNYLSKTYNSNPYPIHINSIEKNEE